VIGVDAGFIGKQLNRFVRPMLFSDAAARAWLTHNVEEVSMFEHMLPRLYESQRKA